MIAGLVILVASCPRQRPDHRLIAVAQPSGALLHALLQRRALLLKLAVGITQLQAVAHPQQQLRQINRLGQIVVPAQVKTAAATGGVAKRGDQNHLLSRTVALAQRLQNRETVRRRHVQIQQQQIPGILLQPLEAERRITETMHLPQSHSPQT